MLTLMYIIIILWSHDIILCYCILLSRVVVNVFNWISVIADKLSLISWMVVCGNDDNWVVLTRVAVILSIAWTAACLRTEYFTLSRREGRVSVLLLYSLLLTQAFAKWRNSLVSNHCHIWLTHSIYWQPIQCMIYEYTSGDGVSLLCEYRFNSHTQC